MFSQDNNKNGMTSCVMEISGLLHFIHYLKILIEFCHYLEKTKLFQDLEKIMPLSRLGLPYHMFQVHMLSVHYETL